MEEKNKLEVRAKKIMVAYMSRVNRVKWENQHIFSIF